jgi:uncharacterized protein involved in type VI secretion and phage assembly
MDDTAQRTAKQVDERRYGKYRGVVSDNQDPNQRGRVKVSVASVLGDQHSDWALPCFPFGGGAGYGWFAVPPVNAQVWVEFEEGDIHRPIWTGTFHQQGSDVPSTAQQTDPTTYLLQTPNGQIFELVDKSGDEQVRLHHPKNAEILIDKNGSITLTDAKGASVTLDASAGEIKVADANGNSVTIASAGVTVQDASGNKVELTSSGMTLKGTKVVIDAPMVTLGGQGGEPVIKGTSFVAAFMAHTHPSSVGPTGPPIPTGSEMTSLSTAVMTS